MGFGKWSSVLCFIHPFQIILNCTLIAQAVYPASIVTTAPADIVNGVLAGFEKHKININLK
jgi:hypothetical protein